MSYNTKGNTARRDPRIKTVLEIFKILQRQKRPISKNEIRKLSKYRFHPYQIDAALQFLERLGKVEAIKTSVTTFWKVRDGGKVDLSPQNVG